MRSFVNTKTFRERLGQYHVGTKKFDSGFDAIIEATRTGANYTWEFNDDIFTKFDWSKPIETSLDDLYAMRMRQLRNEYDYLVLFLSGGRDSTNILLTAIKNNIFIDEIIMFYPFGMSKHFNKDDLSEGNNFSEIEYAAKPLLKRYENLISPKTKIRDLDISSANIRTFLEDDWFEKTPPSLAFTVYNRTSSVLFDPDIMDLAASGKSVGLIFGADKPKIRFSNGKYFAYFNDIAVNPCIRPKIPDKVILYDKHVFNELFYWTPFLPELAIKQAQVVVAAMKTNPQFKSMMQHTNNLAIRQEIEKVIANYIYSDNERPWQTSKQTPYIYKKVNEWFWQGAPKTAKDNVLYAMTTLSKQIRRDLLIDGDIAKGKNVSFSKLYYIGMDDEKY